MSDEVLAAAQREFGSFELSALADDEAEEQEVGERLTYHCHIAEQFGTWGIKALTMLHQSPTDAAINTVKVQLVDTYIDWCKLLPKSCRNFKGTHSDAKCIPQLLEYIGEEIRTIANTRSPVVVKEPPQIIREKPVYKMGGAPVGIRPDS